MDRYDDISNVKFLVQYSYISYIVVSLYIVFCQRNLNILPKTVYVQNKQE